MRRTALRLYLRRIYTIVLQLRSEILSTLFKMILNFSAFTLN